MSQPESPELQEHQTAESMPPADRPQEPGTPVTDPPTTKRRARVPFAGTWLGQCSALVIAAAIGAAVPLVVGAVSTSSQSSTAPVRRPAYLHISSVGYIAKNSGFPGRYVPGRYEVQGYVLHLAPQQVIWSFNQPVYSAGNTGAIHADPGPCIVIGQNFTCNLGVDVPSAQTEYFKIFVAVVIGYASAAAFPHVTVNHTTLTDPPA
jgi:hypothetical protein